MDGRSIAVWNLPIQNMVIFTHNGLPLQSPSLYVITLQYQDSKTTQIVHIEDNFDSVYDASDLNMVELARNFDDLKSFMERFRGQKYQSNPRFSPVLHDIKTGLLMMMLKL